MKNQWFRLHADFAFNPKVQMVTEALQRRYVMLLCLHCDGSIKNAKDDEIAFALRISSDEWELTKTTLIERGLINDDCTPCGWEKHQYISDVKDPTAPIRQQRYRDRKRNATVTHRNASVTSRLPEADTDTDTDIKKEKDTNVSEKKKCEVDIFDNEFNQFKTAYPLVERGFGSVKEAKANFVIARKKDTFENIISGLERYASYIRTTGQPNKDAFRWLEKEQWRDDYTIGLNRENKINLIDEDVKKKAILESARWKIKMKMPLQTVEKQALEDEKRNEIR